MFASSITVEEIAYRVLPLVQPGRALADSEWRTLVRAAEVLLEGSPVRITPERVADNVETFLIHGRSPRAWRCRALLTLIECMPLATHGRRFSELERSDRRRLIEERYVDGAHLYRLCAKVRYLVLMGAYGDAAAPSGTAYVPLDERARFRASAPRAVRDVVPLSAVRARRSDREDSNRVLKEQPVA